MAHHAGRSGGVVTDAGDFELASKFSAGRWPTIIRERIARQGVSRRTPVHSQGARGRRHDSDEMTLTH